MSRVSDKPYFLYVLWGPSARRFYIGVSENIEKRLGQHNQGLSSWSARYRPWTLVHQERFENYTQARQRESELKKQKGGQGFYRLTGLSPDAFSRAGGASGS